MQQDIVVCTQCDAAHRWRLLSPREIARCRRCGAVLGRGHRLDAEALLALTVAALVVLVIANLTPMMDLRLRGYHSAATFPECIRYTWEHGEHLVALVAAGTAIVAPALLVVLRLLVLVPMTLGRAPRHLAWCMRVLFHAERWSMVEVLLLAAVVSIVRIASMAQAFPGMGMLGYGSLAVLLAALESGGLNHLWPETEGARTAARRTEAAQ
jgi:paraquat-inducible protein A